MKAIIPAIVISVTALQAQEKFHPVPLKIGARAPAFNLEGVDGKKYTLESFKEAKYLVALFTCNHCPDARAARQRINTFAKNYKEKGVQVVAISGNDPKALQPWENGWSVYGDSFEEMKEVAKEEKYVHPYLYDGDTQVTSKAYGALATPHTFVFNQERKLIYHGRFDNGRRNPGPASENNVKEVIDAALEGKEIKTPVTRPFGCSTKWSWKRKIVAQKQQEWEALPVILDPITVEKAGELAGNDTKKIRVMHFWSTTCHSCEAGFPELVDAYRRFQRRGVELITVSLNPKKDEAEVLKFLDKEQLPLSPHGKKSVETEGRRTNNYHFQGTGVAAFEKAVDATWKGTMPYTILIAPGGEIVFRHEGKLDVVELRRAIVKQLEKGQKAE